MMPALDLESFKIAEGAETTGNDVFRDRPASPGADGEYGAGDALEKGQNLVFGQAGSRGQSEARVMPKTQAIDTGFGATFNQEPGSLPAEVGA